MVFPDDFVERFLIELMACNADDGPSCGIAGAAEMSLAIGVARDMYLARARPAGVKFTDALRLECLGDPDLPRAPSRPAPPPFANLVSWQLDETELSTIVTLPTLLRLLHEDDKEVLEAEESLTLAVTGSSDGEALLEEIEEMLSTRLPNLAESRRKFQIASDESHGRPYVWFTAREDLERKLADSRVPGRTRADIARDALGLVHHTPTAYRSRRPNHLVALHFPAAIAGRAGHMRPSAVQAFDNRRFVVQLDSDVTTAADWGKTLDLHVFRTRNGIVPIGCRERVLLRLQAALFEPHERMTFEYLGRVESTRGDITIDSDSAFLKLVARDRVPADLVRSIRP
jgi:hypothetical protein